MLNPVSTNGESITSGKSTYFISEPELSLLKNKNVFFVDDVFSTGSTFNSMLYFAKTQGFNIVACATILRECSSDQQNNKNVFIYHSVPIYYCGYLPLPDNK